MTNRLGPPATLHQPPDIHTASAYDLRPTHPSRHGPARSTTPALTPAGSRTAVNFPVHCAGRCSNKQQTLPTRPAPLLPPSRIEIARQIDSAAVTLGFNAV